LIMTDHIAAIAQTLRDAGVSAIQRNQLMAQIRAAVVEAGGDSHSRTPLSSNMSAAEERELGYAVNLAVSTARRLGVQLNPSGKPITASAFSEKARGRGQPHEIMAAKSMAASVGLLVDD
jgi:hypothetical protein